MSTVGRGPIGAASTAILAVVLITVVGVWYFAIRDTTPDINPERQARAMLEQNLAETGSTAAIGEVTCVTESTRHWQCVVSVVDGGPQQQVAGTLVCETPGEGGQCLWRGPLAGG